MVHYNRTSHLKCLDDDVFLIGRDSDTSLTGWPFISFGFRSAKPACHVPFSRLPRVSTVDESKRQEHRDDILSLLDIAIEAMNLAKEISSPMLTEAVLGSGSL